MIAPTQLPTRRFLAQRSKVDENANSKHARQSLITGTSRIAGKENIIKAPPARTALGEVTLAAVNRKVGFLFTLNSPSETLIKPIRMPPARMLLEKKRKKQTSSEAGQLQQLFLSVCPWGRTGVRFLSLLPL
jgi:hypothetical protein